MVMAPRLDREVLSLTALPGEAGLGLVQMPEAIAVAVFPAPLPEKELASTRKVILPKPRMPSFLRARLSAWERAGLHVSPSAFLRW